MSPNFSAHLVLTVLGALGLERAGSHDARLRHNLRAKNLLKFSQVSGL